MTKERLAQLLIKAFADRHTVAVWATPVTGSTTAMTLDGEFDLVEIAEQVLKEAESDERTE